MWQDYVLAGVQVFFCVTLVPMLLAKEKPPLLASLPTGIALLVSSAIFFSLSLWLAAVSQAVVGCQWLLLAYQKLRGPSR